MTIHAPRPLVAALVALAALLGTLSSLAAQPARPATNYILSARPDRPAALYQQGETITFTISLTLDQQPAKKRAEAPTVQPP